MTAAPELAPDDDSNVHDITEALARRDKKRAQAPTLDALFQADLARSGLTLVHARKLGFDLAGPDELWKLLRPKNPERPKDFTAEGYVIPYWHPSGKRLAYARVRKLRGSWGKDKDDAQRYAAPLNSLPHLYFPAPLLGWVERAPKGKKILASELGFTEGEKKAAKAALFGIACVALGGVDAYRSARHGVLLLDEIKEWFDLKKTDATMVYDSDAYSNPDVLRALRAFSDVLRRDAHPRSICQKRLTHENVGDKTALDDFLAQFKTAQAARRAYSELEGIADPMIEAFATFDRELVHVKRQTKYYNLAHGTWYPSQQKIVEEYGVGTPVLSAKGKEVYPITRWFPERNANETSVLDVWYTPGKPERYPSPDGAGDVLNTWRAGPLEPTPYKGPAQVAEFTRFIEYLTAGITEAERAWFLDWISYPVQHPGAKLMSAAALWSTGNGVGKNTLANRILKKIYGDANCHVLDGSALASEWNDWTQHQFIIVNEIDQPSYGQRAAAMARLKTLITENEVDLNRRYLARTNVPNHMNFMFTSNKPDALMIDESDRRFFIVRCADNDAKWSEAQFNALNAWLDGGGLEKVYGYLKARDLKNFNPYAEPPKTQAWKEMVESRYDPLRDLVATLVSNPTKVLGTYNPTAANIEGSGYTRPTSDLFTFEQIVEGLKRRAEDHDVKPAAITVGTVRAAIAHHRLTKRGPMEFKGKGERRSVSAYALFDVEKWAKASADKWREHLKKHNAELP
jgi:uncharacterized protein DUF5906